jgi:hypothetical protein
MWSVLISRPSRDRDLHVRSSSGNFGLGPAISVASGYFQADLSCAKSTNRRAFPCRVSPSLRAVCRRQGERFNSDGGRCPSPTFRLACLIGCYEDILLRYTRFNIYIYNFTYIIYTSTTSSCDANSVIIFVSVDGRKCQCYFFCELKMSMLR